MLTVLHPVVSIKRRFGGRIKAASLNAPPPPIETRNEWKFGPYSWKAIVESRDKNGEVDRTFIGYSPDMNITMKTQVACDRYKREGTECGEVNLVMKGGDSKEVILMKKKDSDVLLPITMY
mgnify:FL=1|jgi:hypothetical protein|tara:strand:- start:65 stop:427 length:363 start_codon:yes stop_codon:yes gene_type:complete